MWTSGPALEITDRIGAESVIPNLLVHGDCADALVALAQEPLYAAQVRLAYLDPPFNTGERFRDFDDAMDREDWSDFMAERLTAVWGQLRVDGSLWVHCDDAEQATLRVLMDELFGREAFVSTVVWQRRYSRENRLAFSRSHDYLHVFAPAGGEWKRYRNRLPRNDKPGAWRNPDDDIRGPWSTVSLTAQGGHGTPGQFYAITLPSGRVVEPPPGSCWRVTGERFAALQRDGLIWCGADGDNVPRRKVYLNEALGLVPSTWWTHAEVGHNAEANAELRGLFPGEIPFSTPKPERLMARIVNLASDPGDLVLDPFLGSGTTVAVAHKAERSWVGIEASESTIQRFAEPRLRSVLDGPDVGSASEIFGWTGGGGFCCATASATTDRELAGYPSAR
jgi:adenine-specific DNA-methyltransferase